MIELHVPIAEVTSHSGLCHKPILDDCHSHLFKELQYSTQYIFDACSASVVKDLFKILRSDHRPFVLTVQQEVFQAKQFACCFFPIVFDDVINAL